MVNLNLKASITLLIIMLLGVCGLFFGCGDKYASLTVSIPQDSVTGAALDDNLNSDTYGYYIMYMGDEPMTIDILANGAPGGFTYTFGFWESNDGIVVADTANSTRITKGVRQTVAALEPGKTTLTAITSEGGKSASINIAVIQRATGISFKTSNLAIVRGGTMDLNYTDAVTGLNFLPQNSNQYQISYTLDNTQANFADVDSTVNVYQTSSGAASVSFKTLGSGYDGSLQSFKIQAQVLGYTYNPTNEEYEWLPYYFSADGTTQIALPSVAATVNIVDILDNTAVYLGAPNSSGDIVSSSGKVNQVIGNGTGLDAITLVRNGLYKDGYLNGDLSITQITVMVESSYDLTVAPMLTLGGGLYPVNMLGSPLQVSAPSVQKFNIGGVNYWCCTYIISALAVYSGTLQFDIGYANYTVLGTDTDDVYAVPASINVNCESLPTDYAVNGVTNTQTAPHEVTVYEDDQTQGTKIAVTAYVGSTPMSSADTNGSFTVELLKDLNFGHGAPDYTPVPGSVGSSLFNFYYNSGLISFDENGVSTITLPGNSAIYAKVVSNSGVGLNDGEYVLKITAVQPDGSLQYLTPDGITAYQAYAYINLFIKQGITSLDSFDFYPAGGSGGTGLSFNSSINIDLTASTASGSNYILINSLPSGGDIYSISASPSNGNIIKTDMVYGGGQARINITPLITGKTQIVVVCSTLPTPYVINVNVFKPITAAAVSIQNADNNSNVGYYDTGMQNGVVTLNSVIIKVNQTVSFGYVISPNDAPKDIPPVYTVTDNSGTVLTPTAGSNLITDGIFILDTAAQTVKISGIGYTAGYKYTVNVTFNNYNNEDSVTVDFTVQAYVSVGIPSVTIYPPVLYNPKTLGYEDQNSGQYTALTVTVAVDAGATYQFSPANFNISVNGQPASPGFISYMGQVSGNMYKFALNNYDYLNGQIVYISATVYEFNDIVGNTSKYAHTGSASFTINNAIPVTGLAASNIASDGIYFKQGVTPDFNLNLAVSPDKPFNNQVVLAEQLQTGTDSKGNPIWQNAAVFNWVYTDGKFNEYIYLSDGTVLAGSNLANITNYTDLVFNVGFVSANQYIISPLSAGNARLIVVPKDKITSALTNAVLNYNNWAGALTIAVSVADGSYAYPFHVHNAAEFIQINDALNKYYVLVSDITLPNTSAFVAFGLDADTAFTGGLNGYFNGNVYSISIAYLSGNMDYYGLFYQNGGIIQNLKINISTLTISQQGGGLCFGGAACINGEGGVILNVNISYPTSSSSSYISADGGIVFGGVAGQNYGAIIYDSVNGAADKATGVTGNVWVNIAEGSSNFAGGIAGQNYGVIKGTLDLSGFENPKIVYADAQITSNLNIIITGSAAAYSGTGEPVSAFGGAVGINYGGSNGSIDVSTNSISGVLQAAGCTYDAAGNPSFTLNYYGIFGVSAFGNITASGCDCVGGLAGANIGGSIYNSYSACVTAGQDYVGGLIGVSTGGTIYNCSAENYMPAPAADSTYVAGNNYVGGLIGSAVGTNEIWYSYTISYFTDVHEDIVASGSYCGGFIGYVTGSLTLNSVASVVNVLGGAFTNSFIGSGSYSGNNINPTTPSLLTLNFNDASAPMYDSGASPVSTTPLFASGTIKITADVNPSNYTNSDATEPSFVNTGDTGTASTPVILYYTAYAGQDISAADLLKINNMSIDDFMTVTVNPLTAKSGRLTLTAGNTSGNKVISINNADGTIQLLGEGNATVIISSTLNYTYYITVYITVKNGLNGFAVFNSSNLTQTLGDSQGSLGDPSLTNVAPQAQNKDGSANITVLTNSITVLFPVTANIQTYNNKPYNFTSGNAGVEYRVYAADISALNTAYPGLDITNADKLGGLLAINGQAWTLADTGAYYYCDVGPGSYSYIVAGTTEINSAPIQIYAVPYITYNTADKTMLEDLATSFTLQIIAGAKDIYLQAGSTSVAFTQLDSYTFAVVMDSDWESDEINEPVVSVAPQSGLDPTNLIVSFDYKAINLSSLTPIIGDDIISYQYIYTYTISFYNQYADDGTLTNPIVSTQTYTITFAAASNGKSVSLTVNINPISIVSADLSLYSQFSDYSSAGGNATMVYNNTAAAMVLEIYPYFSQFNYFTVTYSNPSGYQMILTQIQYTPNATDNNFDAYDNSGAVAVNNGLRINKNSGTQDLIAMGSYGVSSYSYLYYFSIYVAGNQNGAQIPDMTAFNVHVTFYDDNNQIMEPKNVDYNFYSTSTPDIRINLADSSLNNTLPLNTAEGLNVALYNYTGSISWNLYLGSAAYTGVSPFIGTVKPGDKDDYNSYSTAFSGQLTKIKEGLNGTASGNSITVTDSTMAGKWLTIVGTITKNNRVVNCLLSVFITQYTITGITVSELSSGTLTATLYTYTPLSVKLTVAGTISPADLTSLSQTIAANANWAYTDNNTTITPTGKWQQILPDGTTKYNTIFTVQSSAKGTDAVTGCIDGMLSVYGYNVNIGTSMYLDAAIYYYGNTNLGPDGKPVSDALNGTPQIVPATTDKGLATGNYTGNPPAVSASDLSVGTYTTDINGKYNCLNNFSSAFILTFTYQSSLTNPTPISTSTDFVNMVAGKDYRLTDDIILNNYTPLSTQIASLDGNGRTIFITGFNSSLWAPGATLNLGLFDTVSEGTLLSNLTVCYCGDAKLSAGQMPVDSNNVPIKNGETQGAFNAVIGTPSNAPLNLVYTNTALATVNFGGIAAINGGAITNACVKGSINTSGISAQAFMNGGIVAVNGIQRADGTYSGYITNSNVTGFTLTCLGNAGGVACVNYKTISNTYCTGLTLINSDNRKNPDPTTGGTVASDICSTGGFVYCNAQGGTIFGCYSEGIRLGSDVTIQNTGGGLSTSSNEAGFVYRNIGSVTNCYSNISMVTSSSVAGFVYCNNSQGVITNCYSVSKVPAPALNVTEFTGGSGAQNVFLNAGTIAGCYFISDPNNAGEEAKYYNDTQNKSSYVVAIPLNVLDFSVASSFPTYNITPVDKSSSTVNSGSGYIWQMQNGKPILIDCGTPTLSLNNYLGRSASYSTQNTYALSGDAPTIYGTNTVVATATDGSSVSVTYSYDGATTATITSATYTPKNGLPVNVDLSLNINYDGSNGAAADPSREFDIVPVDKNGSPIFIVDDNGNPTLTFKLSDKSSNLAGFIYNTPNGVIYVYNDLTKIGSTVNDPILIYNTVSYNYYLGGINPQTGQIQQGISTYLSYNNDNGNGLHVENASNAFYMFVADLDFNHVMPPTSGTELINVVICGNNMNIDNITLLMFSLGEDVQPFGLFAKTTDTVIYGLNLKIKGMQSSSNDYVGGLAGRADGTTYINYVNVGPGSAAPSTGATILGRNIVGGIIGWATGTFKIDNCNANINVNAVYTDNGNKYYIYDPNAGTLAIDTNSMVSYAGGVVGVLDASGTLPGESYNAVNITVSGNSKAAGRTVGGVFGLVGENSSVKDINYILSNSGEYVNGDFAAGGLVGENRGEIDNSAVKYSAVQQKIIDSASAGMLSAAVNATFFNESLNNAGRAVAAIGGLVGFNNGGTVKNCSSSADVRSDKANTAGGAVGRMIGGTLTNIAVSCSVRAQNIMGGLVGIINTAADGANQKTGVFYGGGVDTQGKPIVDQRGLLSGWDSAEDPGTEDITINNCVAAVNWIAADYNIITIVPNVLRVVSGLIGLMNFDYLKETGVDAAPLEANNTTDAVDMTAYYVGNSTEPGTINLQINGNYFTNSLYATAPTVNTDGSSTSGVSHYIYPAYIGGAFDTVSADTKNTGNDAYPQTAVAVLGDNNIGLTHTQIMNGLVQTTPQTMDNNGLLTVASSNFTYNNFGTGANNQMSLQAYIYNMCNLIAAVSEVGGLVGSNAHAYSINEIDWDAVVAGGDDAPPNPVSIILVGSNYQYLAALDLINPDGGLIPSLSLKTNLKQLAFTSGFINSPFVWDTSNIFSYSTSNTRLPNIIPGAAVHVWTEFASADFGGGAGTSGEPYWISTPQQLAYLAKQVNAGNSYSDKYFKLGADIDLSGNYWVPVGTAARPFSGTFNGNNCTIKYATVNNFSNTDDSGSTGGVTYAGLFGCVSGAAIQALTLTGSTISGVIAGGIAAYATDTGFANCINNSGITGSVAAGGIAGIASGASSISNCTNNGAIRLNTTGLKDATANDTNTLTQVYNSLSGITADGTNMIISIRSNILTLCNYIGGLAGYIKTINGANLNNGSISVSDKFTDYINSYKIYPDSLVYTYDNMYAGGLAGQAGTAKAADASPNNTILNTNSGAVNVNSNADKLFAGGCFGECGTMSYAANYGVLNVSYQNTKNTSNNDNDDNDTNYTQDAIPVFAVGGIAGEILNSGICLSNFANITFSGATNYSIGGVGGVTGLLAPSAAIEQSYNVGIVRLIASYWTSIIGQGGIAGMVINESDAKNDVTAISNCYNSGSIISDNKSTNFAGGIFGVVTYLSGTNYNIGASLIKNSGGWTFGISGSNDMLKISNTYNTGAVSITNAAAYNFSGGTVGYDSNIGWSNDDTINHNNYYLVGTAASGGAYTDSNSSSRTLNGNISGEVTSSSLKAIDFDTTYWSNIVPTWYPTLINNWAAIYWQDYRVTLTSDGTDSKTKLGVYSISSAGQLAELSAQVAGGLDTTGLTFNLTNNIDLSNMYFTPIGTAANPFKGIFNGNGYQVSYLTVDGSRNTGSAYGALFGYTSGAHITNVGLYSPIIDNVDVGAGLVCFASNTTIDYIYTDMPVGTVCGIAAGSVAGGIAAYLDNSSSLTCSYNNVPVSAPVGVAGGIAGVLSGGMISTPNTIQNCYNNSNGAVSAVGTAWYTGIVGEIDANLIDNSDKDHNPISGILLQNYNLAKINSNDELYIVQTKTDAGNHISFGPTVLPSYGTIGANISGFEDAGFDMTNIWTSEYSLNELSQYPSIRGLGQNWLNTECADIPLKDKWGNTYAAVLNGYNTNADYYTVGNHTYSVSDGEPLLSSFSYYWIGDGNAKPQEDLAWVAQQVNSSGSPMKTAGYTFVLCKDVDLSSKYFTPIGNLNNPFSGTFDFNGHSITGLKIDASTLTYVGLFGYTNGATITSTDVLGDGAATTGSLSADYIKINNTQTGIQAVYAGTLVGYGCNTNISNLTVNTVMNIFGVNNVYAGGLAGSLYGNSDGRNSYGGNGYVINNIQVSVNGAGVVFNSADEDLVTESGNNSSAFSNIGIAACAKTGNAYAGGIAGSVSGVTNRGIQYPAIVVNVFSNINIFAKNLSGVPLANINGLSTYAGGIAGYTNNQVLVDTAENMGNIKSYSIGGFEAIGGIIGFAASGTAILNAYNNGAYLEGSITTAQATYIGGIAGQLDVNTAIGTNQMGTSYIGGGSKTIYDSPYYPINPSEPVAQTGSTINTGSAYYSNNKTTAGGIFGYAAIDITSASSFVNNPIISGYHVFVQDGATVPAAATGFYNAGTYGNTVLAPEGASGQVNELGTITTKDGTTDVPLTDGNGNGNSNDNNSSKFNIYGFIKVEFSAKIYDLSVNFDSAVWAITSTSIAMNWRDALIR